MAATGIAVAGALVTKALPMAYITPLISTVGTASAEAVVHGVATTHAIQNWFSELLNVRRSVDEADLVQLQTVYKIEAARTHLELMVSRQGVSPQDEAYRLHQVQQAEAALIEGRALLRSAGAVTMVHDDKKDDPRSLWPHLLHCHHLLICITYWHASDLGKNPPTGFRTAVTAVNSMFEDFGQRRAWAQSQTFYKESKTKQVDNHYIHWGGQAWERQIEQVQRQGLSVNMTKDAACGNYVTEIKVMGGDMAPGLMHLDVGACRVCGIGVVVGSGCSNASCGGGGNAVWSWQDDSGRWMPYSEQDTRKLEIANARGQVRRQQLYAIGLTQGSARPL